MPGYLCNKVKKHDIIMITLNTNQQNPYYLGSKAEKIE